MKLVHIQKLILFLLRKDIKNFTLTIGELFNASFECLAIWIKNHSTSFIYNIFYI